MWSVSVICPPSNKRPTKTPSAIRIAATSARPCEEYGSLIVPSADHLTFTYVHESRSQAPGSVLQSNDVDFNEERKPKVHCRKRENKNGWDQHDLVDPCPQFPPGVGVYEPSETVN